MTKQITMIVAQLRKKNEKDSILISEFRFFSVQTAMKHMDRLMKDIDDEGFFVRFMEVER